MRFLRERRASRRLTEMLIALRSLKRRTGPTASHFFRVYLHDQQRCKVHIQISKWS